MIAALLLILAAPLMSTRDLATLDRYMRSHPRRQCCLCGAYVQHVGLHVRRDHADVLAHPAY